MAERFISRTKTKRKTLLLSASRSERFGQPSPSPQPPLDPTNPRPNSTSPVSGILLVIQQRRAGQSSGAQGAGGHLLAGAVAI